MFKIGEKVVVKDSGYGYNFYDILARDVMELGNFVEGDLCNNGDVVVVKAKSYHEDRVDLIYGIEVDGQHYLYPEEALELYTPLSEKVRTVIKSFVSEEKPFVVDLENVDVDIRLQFQEYLFSLGVEWVSSGCQVHDRGEKFYDISRFNGYYCLGLTHHNIDFSKHDSIDLLTGEIENNIQEYTMEELIDLVGHNFKVVK